MTTITLTDQQFADIMRALMIAESEARGADQTATADRYDALWRNLASGYAVR